MGYANGVGPRGDQGLDKKIEQFGLVSSGSGIRHQPKKRVREILGHGSARSSEPQRPLFTQ